MYRGIDIFSGEASLSKKKYPGGQEVSAPNFESRGPVFKSHWRQK